MRRLASGLAYEIPSLWSNPFTSARRSTTLCSRRWLGEPDVQRLGSSRSPRRSGSTGSTTFNRGMAASPPSIMVGGMIQGIFVVVAAVLMLRHHRRASGAAITVGFGSVVLFVYAHLLPTFLPSFQDSFISGPRINVTWFSWLTPVAEIGTGLTLGYVGLQARRRSAVDLSVRGCRETL
jgi:hypothetical protein